MDSLFSFIKSYIPSAASDPKEDYLTQLLAWMLAHIPGLGTKYCQFLLGKVHAPKFDIVDGEEVGVQTQVVVELGRIDLLLTVGKNCFVCEHKVASNLGDQQMLRYAKSFESSHAGRFHTALVTARRSQHTQDADIMLTWPEVSDFLISMRGEYENEHGFLIEELIRYLQQQGLGRMEPVNMENIMGYFPGLEPPAKLETLLMGLQPMDWATECPGLQQINPEHYMPAFKKMRWGRIGVELFEGMAPGLFAGVMLDYSQIPSLEVHDKQLGPDVVIMLEYDYFGNPKNDYEECMCRQRRSLLANHTYRTLCTQLEASARDAGFRFARELPKSRWRILVLQIPLSTVLRGAQTEQEQLDRLFQAMCHGINLITQDNLLAQAFQDIKKER